MKLMNNKNWGTAGWTFLHTITYSYPDNPTNSNIDDYYNFFSNLKNVLPCQMCKDNMKKHLETYPLTRNTLKSKRELINWLINIHNEVNKMTGKKVLTYEQVDNIYNPDYTKYYLFINIFVLIIVLLLCIFYILKKS